MICRGLLFELRVDLKGPSVITHSKLHFFPNPSFLHIQRQHYCKAEGKKSMSQSCRVHLFFGARLIQQNSSF